MRNFRSSVQITISRIPAIDGHTDDTFIVQKGNIKVGIFGVGVELKGLVPDDKYKETVYIDPIDICE